MLLKQALQVKHGEEPYKFVKPLPTTSEVKRKIKITEPTMPVFGSWQTEPYDPPTAQNVCKSFPALSSKVEAVQED